MSTSTFDYHLAFLNEGQQQLKDYLLSNEVFWQLGLRPPNDRPPYPQLTLGNLLLVLAQLRGLDHSQDLTAAQVSRLKEAQQDLASTREEWGAAWQKKAQKELEQRLRLWSQYLDDLDRNPRGQADRYGTEVRNRALLELVQADLSGDSGASQQEIAAQDQRLKQLTTGGDFVWEQALKAAFPKNKYWFLYAQAK